MRRSSLILALALGLLSTNVHADLKELIVQQEEEFEEIDLLEQLVQAQKEPPMQQRLYTFFKKHKVRQPAFLAKLLAKDKRAKHMAVIAVLESRGNARAVNSRTGATGLFGVMQFWKKSLHITGDLKDPIVNYNAARRILDIHVAEAKSFHQALVNYSGRTPGYANQVLTLANTI